MNNKNYLSLSILAMAIILMGIASNHPNAGIVTQVLYYGVIIAFLSQVALLIYQKMAKK